MRAFSSILGLVQWQNYINRSPRFYPSFMVAQFWNSENSHAKQILCWKCQKALKKNILCTNCEAIQPLPPNLDYYTYLDIKFGHQMDKAELKNKFFNIQKSIHPDKFARKSDTERKYSDDHVHFLNEAYNTLKDPARRAKYILDVIDRVPTTSDKQSSTESAEGLMKFIELNEKIESEESEKGLNELLKNLDLEIDRVLGAIHAYLESKELSHARQSLDELSYLKRSKNNINKKLGIDDSFD